MGREQISGGDITYYKANELKVGQAIVGRYVKQGQDQYGNSCFHFQGTDGKRFVMNYTTSLERAMENASVGATLEIIYNGTVKLEKGPFAGKDAHRFEVYKLTGSDAPAIATEDTVVPEDEECPL